jgi:hypothetical protein
LNEIQDRQVRKKQIGQVLGTAVCLGILLLASSGCKNSTTPDGNEKPRITVRNNCGLAVDIYMDGVYQFYLENKEYYYIENVTAGTHTLEAKRKGTETLLKFETVEVSATSNYTWTIGSTATVTIINHYGETLSVYGDGAYQTDLKDQESNLVQNVPYGEHLFEAKRPNESEVLASTHIEVLEDKAYTWTITK